MLLTAALASVGLALCVLNVEAAASNEYVRINRGNSQLAVNSTHQPHIQIKDDGQIGVQYKPYPVKKSETKPQAKDLLGIKATIKDEGTTGILKKSGVPSIKHLQIDEDSSKEDLKYEVVQTKKDGKKKIKRDEGGLDFDDDENPLAKKKLKPAGTAQASRVNVKKGPNGQDYEYEYVYYYYDDEDEKADGSPAADAKTVAVTPTAKIAEPERGNLAQTRNRGAIEIETEPPVAVIPEPTQKTRQHNRVEPVPQPPQAVQEEEEGESEDEPLVQPTRRRQENRGDDRSSTRYTTIERGRPAAPAEPSTNEVFPSRGSSRSRGRQQTPLSDPTVPSLVEDERLPQANARFPSRGRGSGAAVPAVTTIQTPVASQSGSRSRNSGGATIRRPSLVDSSSFRTHSSDVAPDADQGKYYEEEVPVNKGSYAALPEDASRPTTFTPSQTTSPAPPLPPLPEQPTESGMPDKAALDLYAILQQTQEENSVSGAGGELGSPQDLSEAVTTELLTTMIATTTTTSTTTTTPEPTTTTTTTTTTTPQPAPASGRGRFRTSGIGGGRTRLRPGASSTTTTTEEAPKEESVPTRRNKFQPSRTHSPSSAYSSSRRGATRTSTSTAVSTAETETSTARVRNSFGAASGNRYRSRGRITPAPAPQAEEEQSDSQQQQQQQQSTAAPSTRPTRPRLNVSAATRPLRPGPRINLRGRAGLTGASTAAPAPSQAPEEAEAPAATTPPPTPQHHEEEHPSSSPAPGDALSRLKNRPRLKVMPRAPGTSTAGAAASPPRPLPHGIKRRPLPGSAAAPVEQPVQEASTEVPAENEQPAEQPAQTEPPASSTAAPPAPHSNLVRRRPNIRRLQVPHSTAS